MLHVRREPLTPYIPVSRGSGRYYDERARVARTLKKSSSTWYLLGQVASSNVGTSLAYQIRNGGSGWTQFGPGYEAQCVTVCGEHRIYVRYTSGAGDA